jgi:hypothetical protein
MGVGQRKLINIVLPGEETGTDGVEPSFTFSKQVWAEVNEVSTSSSFTGQQAGASRVFTFLIDYDSEIPVDFNIIVELDNYQFLINVIDRGDRESSGNKYGYKFIPNNDGMYLRLTGGSESRG